MSLIDTFPQVLVTLFSALILNIQNCKDHELDELDESDESDNDVPDTSSRFSTTKKDVIKIGFTLIQVGSFVFLFGWRFDQEQDKNSALSAGLFAICWVIN
jgi:hypothetical protein